MASDGNILWDEFRQTGSRAAFKRLFDAYYDTLVRYAYWFIKSKEDSEEVILDLMLHLWKSRESIEISESFHSYIMTSVRNRASTDSVRLICMPILTSCRTWSRPKMSMQGSTCIPE